MWKLSIIPRDMNEWTRGMLQQKAGLIKRDLKFAAPYLLDCTSSRDSLAFIPLDTDGRTDGRGTPSLSHD